MENNENINDKTNFFLDKIKKKGDFKIPNKYFDEFDKQVQDKIKHKDLQWYKLPEYRIALVSLATFFTGLVLVFNFNKPIDVVNNEFSDEEINNYFEEHIDEYNVAEIIQEISLQELNDIQIEVKDTLKNNSNKKIESINDLTEDEIMEYLINEGYEDGDWDEL